MPPPNEREILQKNVLIATAAYIHLVSIAATLYSQPNYWQQPYHTSVLSGHGWVRELIYGHPGRIYNELGMQLHVFLTFVGHLRTICQLNDSKKGITVEEQAAIFLYTCVTGLSIRHIGERFQHAPETISKYFRRVLFAVSSGPFYDLYVKLPPIDAEVPNFIRENPKFFPYFQKSLGAIDGTHINCTASRVDRHAARDRKGGLTQNCLAVCTFDLRFLYMITGFEGSAADAHMFLHSRLLDFAIPNGRNYIADAGFALCNALLTPYRGVRYHLAEWGRAGVRPVNKEELFNLRHAQARNVIERIFGVLKKRWDILTRAPRYDMDIQARIPAGLAAIHNFIMEYDEDDVKHHLEDIDIDIFAHAGDANTGELGEGVIRQVERDHASNERDAIAQAMWLDYQQYLQDHPEILEAEFVPDNM